MYSEMFFKIICVICVIRGKFLTAKVSKHFKHMSHIRYKDKVLRIF